MQNETNNNLTVADTTWLRVKTFSDSTVYQLEVTDELFYELTLEDDKFIIEKFSTDHPDVIILEGEIKDLELIIKNNKHLFIL